MQSLKRKRNRATITASSEANGMNALLSTPYPDELRVQLFRVLPGLPASTHPAHQSHPGPKGSQQFHPNSCAECYASRDLRRSRGPRPSLFLSRHPIRHPRRHIDTMTSRIALSGGGFVLGVWRDRLACREERQTAVDSPSWRIGKLQGPMHRSNARHKAVPSVSLVPHSPHCHIEYGEAGSRAAREFVSKDQGRSM